VRQTPGLWTIHGVDSGLNIIQLDSELDQSRATRIATLRG